jgi:hypothetical protein
LTTLGAARGGYLAEKGILLSLVLFKSAAGFPFGENQQNHWAAWMLHSKKP